MYVSNINQYTCHLNPLYVSVTVSTTRGWVAELLYRRDLTLETLDSKAKVVQRDF
jgi:hypothetical protein